MSFRPNGRNPIQNAVKFEREKGEEAFFQRRNVDFVKWGEKLYEWYHEMDRDLAELNGVQPAGTVVRGPFGVFPKNELKRPVGFSAEYSELPPEKRHKPELVPVPDVVGHDQLWLSNELKDHALLTAAALNGDTQFLDFVDSFPVNNYQAIPELTDFLNLVFHRHLALRPPVPTPPLAPPAAPPTQTTPQSTQNPQPHELFPFFSAYEPKTLEIQLHALHPHNKDDESTDIVEGDSLATHMPEDIMLIVQQPLQPRLGFDISLPKNGVTLPQLALQVQPLCRYLLNYYVTHVADLMTVIPLTENPWKTIYFPRALMAIGELSALGKTLAAKNALLNALLAVAAFNLQLKFPKNSHQMKFYLNLGIRLRNQASLFVRTLLQPKTPDEDPVARCVAQEKYKDVLCAVMLMISVDLVWGTMQDTNFYIKWCEKVIYTKMSNKKKLLSKARIMHRIFLSLKLIQDLTCLDIGSIREAATTRARYLAETHRRLEADGFGDNGDKTQQSNTPADDKATIHYIVDRHKATPKFVDKKLINADKNDANFASDALYGLPELLISLFSETVHMLRHKILLHPQPLGSQVEVLQNKLRRWELDWKLYETVGNSKNFFSSMHEATFHHIMSFYHALIIYFERLIKETPPENVQHEVEVTLDHLNLIQRLIAKDEAHIIPLFWQGFIAGCEAISKELQMGFKQWGADIAQYLGSYWGARQIMLEVWRRKKMAEERADWVSVLRDWEMNLMLN